MDATHSDRPSLPPIKFMDSEKFKREEHEYQTRHADTPVSTMAPTSRTVHAYPAGPPPPYSAAPHPTHSTPTAPSHVQHPDNLVRRQDERESMGGANKASLPSLHEALGVERHAGYPQEASVAKVPQSAHSASNPHSPPTPRHPQSEPSPPGRSHGYTPVERYPVRAEPSGPSSVGRETYEPRRPEWSDRHAGASYRQSPPPSTASQHPRAPYSTSDSVRSFEASPHGAPGRSSHFAYGYAPPPPAAYAAPIPPPAAAPYPTSRPDWRPAAPTSAPVAGPAPQAYSESVKRHLDLYDFEMALNEIADYSTITLDFSRSYGARLHQTQRAGVTPGVLPAITEVDDLMHKTRHTLEALGKMRENLVAQQALYYQQAQEQHHRNEDAKRNDSIQDDSKAGGFAGSEPKKRRGRNAAPGRCHSCNRAETPEWRRGPDGARTLCNACGLHYAKLTRKAGAANKAAAGGSSLRPKAPESDAGEA